METVIIAVISIFASGGFWTYMQYMSQRKDRQREVITKETVDNLCAASLSTLHTNLYRLTKTVIKRGYITADELDELENVYKPYHALGGNGTGKIYYERAKSLPMEEK